MATPMWARLLSMVPTSSFMPSPSCLRKPVWPLSSRRRDGWSPLPAGGVKPSSSMVPTGCGVSVRTKMPIDEMSVMYA